MLIEYLNLFSKYPQLHSFYFTFFRSIHSWHPRTTKTYCKDPPGDSLKVYICKVEKISYIYINEYGVYFRSTMTGDLKTPFSAQFLMVPLFVPTTCCPSTKRRHLTIITKMNAHTHDYSNNHKYSVFRRIKLLHNRPNHFYAVELRAQSCCVFIWH